MDRRSLLLAFGALTALGLPSAQAQTAAQWPTRSVRFIVPLGPGSGVDITARVIADKLAAKWGKPVVVENKPGGDAIVAITAFTGSERRPHAADGADLDLHRASVPAREAAV
jgi:tripartite-type tricarboxylate transporter receptor subunit TctC